MFQLVMFIVSLFTNIPLNETMDIVYCYQHSPQNFYRETFKKLLQIATGAYFSIEEKYTVKLME